MTLRPPCAAREETGTESAPQPDPENAPAVIPNEPGRRPSHTHHQESRPDRTMLSPGEREADGSFAPIISIVSLADDSKETP
jgi:hypothetical protein